jgi:outer membrane protein OmpA-like peptidoglycan-associated protein
MNDKSSATAVNSVVKPSLNADRSGLLQRKCDCGNAAGLTGGCSGCNKKKLLQQKSSNSTELTEIPPIVHEVLGSTGQPMNSDTRSFMESRFGHDFSQVRVHVDSKANKSAQEVNALAYTVDRNVVFGTGQYSPHTSAGLKLLAHELTHVIQQAGFENKNTVGQKKMVIGQPNNHYEQEADRIAEQVMQSSEQTVPYQMKPTSLPVDNSLIQRQLGGAEKTEKDSLLTRSEEVVLSRNSPGEFAGESQPFSLSLYNFGIDVYEPKPEHKAVLTELGHFLGDNAVVPVIIRVIGFTDSTGAERYNQRLSKHRSNTVKEFLQPLINQRISMSAYGETNPTTTNDTVSGRSRNRRVDIRFTINAPLPTEPLPPRPRPIPPGQEPPLLPPPIYPPPKEKDESLCTKYPLLCGIGVIPFFLPLICVVNPLECLSITCIFVPSLCSIPTFPPTPPEKPPEPPEKPSKKGRPIVQFLPIVRARNTPKGMNDRIGLRDVVTVMAIVVNPPMANQPITITIDGRSMNSGDAAINGQTQIQITNSTPLQIRGTRMSAANFAYNPYLQLAAWWYYDDLVGESNRFSVSTIAENWSVQFGDPPYARQRYGYSLNADMDWVSDSGSYGDLNACQYVELVSLLNENGGMTGMGIGQVDDPNDPDYNDYHPAYDQHGTPFEHTQKTGYHHLKQLWRIRDLRSNSDWSPSNRSGFEIERRFERDPANSRCWHLIVRKWGATVEINGMRSEAGSGSISHEFRNINCDPPPPHDESPPSHDEHPPIPSIAPSVPCDLAELGIRVDQCVETAKKEAIDCTGNVFKFSGGWDGFLQSLDYLGCLENMKQNLLECDRKAKVDTNCSDSPPPPTVPSLPYEPDEETEIA